MKKLFLLFLGMGSFLVTTTLADTKCFLAKESEKIITQEGDCSLRYAPCSTFKIALSLMGYDDGLLIDETHPELPFQKGYVDWLDAWKQSHHPAIWMKNSCVWYSQVLTQKLGTEKFKNYLHKFNYGNQDVSGDKGKNNGLTNCWLSSSLEISPEEQVAFLQSLVARKIPISPKAHEMTKNILFLEELPNGWKLYGKTGSGSQLTKDRAEKLKLQHGWFVGWIEKDGRAIVFAKHIADDKEQDIYASLRAKAETKEKLLTLIKDVEK